MKIKIHEIGEDENIETVARFVSRRIDARLWDSGHLEGIEGSLENNISTMGRLIELLAKKGLLTAPEITELVNGLNNSNATFVE